MLLIKHWVANAFKALDRGSPLCQVVVVSICCNIDQLLRKTFNLGKRHIMTEMQNCVARLWNWNICVHMHSEKKWATNRGHAHNLLQGLRQVSHDQTQTSAIQCEQGSATRRTLESEGTNHNCMGNFRKFTREETRGTRKLCGSDGNKPIRLGTGRSKTSQELLETSDADLMSMSISFQVTPYWTDQHYTSHTQPTQQLDALFVSFAVPRARWHCLVYEIFRGSANACV